MLKKLIAFQRLLLNSLSIIDANSPNMLIIFLYAFAIPIMVFMDIFIFMGNSLYLSSICLIIFPIVSVWMINRIFYGGKRMFEVVPVSRKYIVFNVFLLSIVIIFVEYIMLSIFGVASIGLLIGTLYFVSPQSISPTPEATVHQIIDTTKGNILMLCILVIIIFAGIAITFINNKKIRFSSFVGFATIGYGLLFFLRLSMPTSPNTGEVEFLESFSIMPQGNIILSCVAVATIMICITSVFMGYYLYVVKSNVPK